MARDTFLAQLGATLWGSMRHIISPSIAEGAYHYHEKISFQLFMITPEVGYLLISSDSFIHYIIIMLIHCYFVAQKVRNIKQLPVDLKAFMDGLSSLVLPSQKVMFSPHMYVVLICSIQFFL